MSLQRVRRLRMSRASDTENAAAGRAGAAAPPVAPGEPREATPPTAAAGAPGPGLTPAAGASQSRQRGAQLRRLLALGDWSALVASLCLVSALSSTTNVGTL